MKKQLLFLTTVFTLSTSLYAQQSSEQANAMLAKTDKQFFIENKGQWPSEVLYLTRIGGLDAWITKKGVLYDFFKLEEIQSSEKTTHQLPDKFERKDYMRIGHRVLYELQNTNANPSKEGKQKQAGYYNYFIGNDPSKQASYVGLYKEAIVKNVYNGIDVHYYFDQGRLRYDYIVHPGADPTLIQFTFKGSDKTFINDQGNLVFTTRFGQVQLAELYCYQGNKEVRSQFIATDKYYSIHVADYDKTQDLIIDPLIYSTYLGGSDIDLGYSISIDGSGNAYVTGETRSTDYDITPGAYQTTYDGIYDVFVTKLNATGTGLVYSTYLGGSGYDIGVSIAIDGSGNAYVTGYTNSTNYPTTQGAYQTTHAGGYDVFVTKLNAAGSDLIYSTYIGGSYWDEGYSIAIDGSGNAYVTGYTESTNYPTTPGVYQTNNAGNYDVFVTKLNTTGDDLVYSTYLGGSGDEEGRSIAIDGSGNAYVTGYTESTNYPTTLGVYQTTNAGSFDIFLTKLNTTGDDLVYSTYLGGSGDEEGRSIAIDDSGNAYLTGYTASTNYPTTPGVYQTTYAGIYDVFVTKLNATGSDLVYSTYLGGSNNDFGKSIAIDGSGNAYVTGYTKSTDNPITPGADQTTNGGGWDVFVTQLNATGSDLVYSTYLGGSTDDYVMFIAIDGSGNAYMTGYTKSTDYPTTSGAYQTTYGGGTDDVFVTKLCPGSIMSATLTSAPGTDSQTVCVNTVITNIIYNTTGATGIDTINSGLPPGVTATYAGNAIFISGTPSDTGTYNYSIPLTGGCGTVSATGTITVNACTGIQEQSLSLSLNIYPNPSNGQFTVSSETPILQITVFDALGNEVMSYCPQNTISNINLNNVADGVYWIRVTGANAIGVKKLIITK